MKVLVTGATGNVGRLVVDHLLGSGVEIRALTNNPTKAALPAGVEVAEGYLGKLSTMPTALEGVERMYLAPLPRTAREVVELAARRRRPGRRPPATPAADHRRAPRPAGQNVCSVGARQCCALPVTTSFPGAGCGRCSRIPASSPAPTSGAEGDQSLGATGVGGGNAGR
ncbi:MAG: NAD(P)H-binding protein [Chloroflexi bacterium]|nr:NAD(P)H-binding protein [Chloroflexota bacterium]